MREVSAVWQRISRYAKSVTSLTFLCLLTACSLVGGGDSPEESPAIERFSFLAQSDTAGRFSWEVDLVARAECHLDVDGDGRAEYVLDCARQEQPHTYAEAGSYTAMLTAKDARGRKAIRTHTVRMSRAGDVLQPSFSFTPESGSAPLKVTFDASLSVAPVGSSYRWNFGDGETGVGLQVGHTFQQAGDYLVTLTLSSGADRAEQTQTVAVSGERPTALTWQRLADAPIDRHEAFGGFAADGNLYVFGGYNVSAADPTFQPTRRVDAYDPTANRWTRRKDLPTGLSHAGTAVVGEAIYFAGGYPEATNTLGQTFATNKVWKYDVVKDEYTALPDLPEAYGGGALAVLNGKLHYYGGSDSRRKDTDDHWVLPLEGASSGGWARATGLPLPRNHLGSAVIGGKLYAVGGQSGQDERATYHAEVSVYDSASDTWSDVARLPKALSHNNASTFALNGRIIVLGGEYAYLKSIDNAYAYDPGTDTWEELTNLPLPKNAGVGGHHNGNLYHVTGSTSEDAFKGVFRD